MTELCAGRSSPPGVAACRLRIEGTVQGVGFRPFVYRLATERGLAGWVANDPAGVTIEVEGPGAAVDDFIEAVQSPPPLAVISRIDVEVGLPAGRDGFTIAASTPSGRVSTAVAVDSATCPACLAEMTDPGDRRFGYPFTNCTNCGPRFTIVTGVPYDRCRTTMGRFVMCDECASEYAGPLDRRFHAEPVCCPRCGPQLGLTDADGRPRGGRPVTEAARLLRHGRIVAVKGLGGYHLAVAAWDERAVAALRSRKVREDKPFALMVPDLDGARSICVVGPAEAALLADPSRPIVLLRRRDRPGAPGGPGSRLLPAPDSQAIAPSVAPGTSELGVMLPYTPLHHLLLREVGAPIVLTSGNRSDEPIAFTDRDAYARLDSIADAFLVHDRPIHVRTDDSVARVVDGNPVLLRRSRGYVPRPMALPVPARRPLLACGAQLKNTFCLARGGEAVLSHHIGDLEDARTYESWLAGIRHFEQVLDVRPDVVVHDLHPEYLSTKYAMECDGCELVGVQHHHAHVASCLAEHGETGPVVGVALDGFGWGGDGTMWGGEILVADLCSSRRAGGLAPVPLPGGSAAVREPWRMAVSYLDAAYHDRVPSGLPLPSRHDAIWDQVAGLVRSGRCMQTSSAGRLFDAAAAIVGVRQQATFEGQPAIELEQIADREEAGSYPARVEPTTATTSTTGGPADSHLAVLGADLIHDLAEDVLAGAPPGVASARFHHGVADAFVAAAQRVAAEAGLDTVVLTGGVFQNVVLLTRVRTGLGRAGLRVLTHGRVPPNDGGISFGQVAVAAARQAAAVRPPDLTPLNPAAVTSSGS